MNKKRLQLANFTLDVIRKFRQGDLGILEKSADLGVKDLFKHYPLILKDQRLSQTICNSISLLLCSGNEKSQIPWWLEIAESVELQFFYQALQFGIDKKISPIIAVMSAYQIFPFRDRSIHINQLEALMKDAVTKPIHQTPVYVIDKKSITDLKEVRQARNENVFPKEKVVIEFEDLVLLSSKGIAVVLCETPNDKLVVALHKAHPGVVNAVMSSISVRAKDLLAEDLNHITEVRQIDIDASREFIVDLINRLDAEGKILIYRWKMDEPI